MTLHAAFNVNSARLAHGALFFIAIVCVRDWYEGEMYREKWRKNLKKELISILAHGRAIGRPGMPLVIFVNNDKDGENKSAVIIFSLTITC